MRRCSRVSFLAHLRVSLSLSLHFSCCCRCRQKGKKERATAIKCRRNVVRRRFLDCSTGQYTLLTTLWLPPFLTFSLLFFSTCGQGHLLWCLHVHFSWLGEGKNKVRQGGEIELEGQIGGKPCNWNRFIVLYCCVFDWMLKNWWWWILWQLTTPF